MTWGEQFSTGPARGSYMMPFNMSMSKSAPCSPIKPALKARPATRVDSFHVVHKVPVGDSPYVRAKHVQLVDKDPDRAIALFWAAINSGDRVDSALKDMAIVMKQQNRPHEAIEAIKSLRSRCSDQAQESLDNVLLDLFKRCGRLGDQIDLLKHKLHLIHQGMAFNGKRTKTARSQGKKFQVSVEQEATRLLGNLGWAYMQQSNFVAAEAVYRKALTIESDNNKVCNLGICLMKQGCLEEAKSMLQSVTPACNDSCWASDSHLKSYERAQEMLEEVEISMGAKGYRDNIVQQLSSLTIPGVDTDVNIVHSPNSLWQPQPALPRQPRRITRSALELQLSQSSVDPAMVGAFVATSGFGPSQPDVSPQEMASARPDMASSFRRQSWLQCGSSGSSGGWEDNDLDYISPDESSDGSDAQRCQQDLSNSNLYGTENEEVESHGAVEILLQRLECTPVLDNALFDSPLSLKAEGNLALSPQAQPFNPTAVREPSAVNNSETVSEASVTRGSTSYSPSHAHALVPGTVSSNDRRPVTSDLANEHQNCTDHVGVQDERWDVQPLLSAGMWTTPAFKSIPTDFDNSWNGEDYGENQPASRRSLWLELSETPIKGSSDVVQPLHANSRGLFPPHTTGKQSRTISPLKDQKSTWGLLDFTFNPSDLDFGRANGEIGDIELNCQVPDAASQGEFAEGLNLTGNLSASEMEMRRQRRLRVFQEMTLSKTLQV